MPKKKLEQEQEDQKASTPEDSQPAAKKQKQVKDEANKKKLDEKNAAIPAKPIDAVKPSAAASSKDESEEENEEEASAAQTGGAAKKRKDFLATPTGDNAVLKGGTAMMNGMIHKGEDLRESIGLEGRENQFKAWIKSKMPAGKLASDSPAANADEKKVDAADKTENNDVSQVAKADNSNVKDWIEMKDMSNTNPQPSVSPNPPFDAKASSTRESRTNNESVEQNENGPKIQESKL